MEDDGAIVSYPLLDEVADPIPYGGRVQATRPICLLDELFVAHGEAPGKHIFTS